MALLVACVSELAGAEELPRPPAAASTRSAGPPLQPQQHRADRESATTTVEERLTLLEAESNCLDRAGLADAANRRIAALMGAARTGLPPGNLLRLAVEISFGTILNERLKRSDAESARRLAAAVGAFEAAHRQDSAGPERRMAERLLAYAYHSLSRMQMNAGMPEAAKQSDSAALRLKSAETPTMENADHATGAEPVEAPRRAGDRLLRALYRIDRGEGEGVLRDLRAESAPTAGQLVLEMRLAMSLGDLSHAVGPLELGAEGAMSDLMRASAGPDVAAVAKDLDGYLLYLNLFEANAIGLAADPRLASYRSYTTTLAFWLAEQRKGRLLDSHRLIDAADSDAQKKKLAGVSIARSRRAMKFLADLDGSEGDPEAECARLARRMRHGPFRAPEIEAVDTAERQLLNEQRPVGAIVPSYSQQGAPRENYPRGSAAAFGQSLLSVLPPDSRFVGYARFDSQAPSRQGGKAAIRGPGYVAFVAGPEGVRLHDLGDAEGIDELVARALVTRERPGRSHSPGAETLGNWKDLYDRVWRPLEQDLRDTKHIIVAADDALLAVPFAALFDGAVWLADRHTFSYSLSARDLLADLPGNSRTRKLRPPGPAPGPPALILANPVAPPAPGASPRLAAARFPRLKHAEQEAEAVARHLPDPLLLTGADASELNLLGVFAPRVLHIASHAVVLPFRYARLPRGANVKGQARGISEAALPPSPLGRLSQLRQSDYDEPWLRSALVLSRPQEPGAVDILDGFATAYEIMAHDLRDTELVTLSGCDTGRGQASRRHGVPSLQRAFLNAGAGSVVASLWEVDDESTALWMGAFYGALRSGQTRLRAMQTAMTTVRRQYPHPYHWAAFTLMGATGTLSSSLAPFHAPALPPGSPN